ncbi:MAG: carbon-nitrogen family hydrolase [Ruminococcus sp.]|nr:carbon-nitrogen family hydrolase [Ruminococcus sp.]
MSRIKLAIAQTNIEYLAFEKNFSKGKFLIQQAAERHADGIIFPEMSFTGFSMNTEYTSFYGKRTLSAMKHLAADMHIAIGFGWVCSLKSGLAENHYTFVGPDGAILLDYVKIHPFSYAGEDRLFSSGTSLPIASLDGFPFRCVICYDLRFPELMRTRPEEAAAIFVPANWPEKRSAHWKVLLQARAIENQMYIIGVNCVGMQDGLVYSGDSMVIAPDGTILLDCKNQDGLFFIMLDQDIVTSSRESFPALRDRKTRLYHSL